MRGKRKVPPPVNGPPFKTRKEEDVALQRPKRQVISKNVDQSAGLSWREETDLKKALYASLQESKRLTRGQDDDDDEDDDEVVISPRSRSQGRHLLGPAGQFCADDSSQDSMRTATSSSTQESKKMKVHAQRKFAQGQSLPCTPSTTPVKTLSTPVKLFSKRAKTEDFLTFLCLRGSSVLPPHLDFFGYSRDDSHTGEHRPNTPGQTGRSDSGETRESTPDLSSSSDSDMTYELPDLAALVMKNQQTPTRKAARASASTPETARGLVSIRTRITKKVGKVPAKALLKQSKTLLASPTKMSPREKRALLRHQPTPTKSVNLCSLPASCFKYLVRKKNMPLPLSGSDMDKRRQDQKTLPIFLYNSSPGNVRAHSHTIKHENNLNTEYKNNSNTEHKNVCTEHENVSTEHENVSTEYENVCTEHDNVCTEHDNVCTEHENVCIKHENICTEHENVCTEHENVSTEHENVSTEHGNVSIEHENISTESENVSTEHENVSTEHENVWTEHENVRTEHENVWTEHENVWTEHENVCTEHENVCTEYENVRSEHKNVSTEHENVCTEHENVRISVKNVRMSVQNVRMSVSNMRMSVSNMRISVQNMKMSVQNMRMSVSNMRMSVQNMRMSVQKMRMSTEHENVCIKHENVSTEHENVSTEHENVSTEHVNVSTEHVNVCTEHENDCIKHENASAEHENICTEHENVCTAHENVCTEYENVCTEHENVCTEHENVSTDHKNVSSEHENVSTGHEDICKECENVSTECENVISKHENGSTAHDNVGTEHENVGAEHENVGAEHENISVEHDNVSTEHENVSTEHDNNMRTKHDKLFRTLELDNYMSTSEYENNMITTKLDNKIGNVDYCGIRNQKWYSLDELVEAIVTKRKQLHQFHKQLSGDDLNQSDTALPSDILTQPSAQPDGGLYPCSNPIAHASLTPLPSPPSCVIKALEKFVSMNHPSDWSVFQDDQSAINNLTNKPCYTEMMHDIKPQSNKKSEMYRGIDFDSMKDKCRDSCLILDEETSTQEKKTLNMTRRIANDSKRQFPYMDRVIDDHSLTSQYTCNYCLPYSQTSTSEDPREGDASIQKQILPYLDVNRPTCEHEAIAVDNQRQRGYFIEHNTDQSSIDQSSVRQNRPFKNEDGLTNSDNLKQICMSTNIDDITSDVRRSERDHSSGLGLEFPPLVVPLTVDFHEDIPLPLYSHRSLVSSEEQSSSENVAGQGRSFFLNPNSQLVNSPGKLANETTQRAGTVELCKCLQSEEKGRLHLPTASKDDTIPTSESNKQPGRATRRLDYHKSVGNLELNTWFEDKTPNKQRNEKFYCSIIPDMETTPFKRPFLYSLPPVLCSNTMQKNKSNCGHDGKGAMSKPVRASATPSKKRITPQSLPIGSLPKFYIDDSDSSVQSRDPKEVFVNRRGKSHVIAKKAKPLRMKIHNLNLKRNLKKAFTSKSKVKIVTKKTAAKQSPEKKVPLKMKGLHKKLPPQKVTRPKEKTGGAGSMRKKRMAAMAKNYAEDHDDDLESIDDLEHMVHMPVTSKPVKKTLVTKKVNNKGENRRKIVAASLAKMSAAKKLSQVKKAANRKKLKQNIPAAILKNSKSDKTVKSKVSRRKSELKPSEKEDQHSSSPSTPKRRGRPRPSRLSSSPGDRTDDPVLFPSPDDGGHIVEVPTFYPTSKEFQDPLKYIASIRQEAEPYGMCRVIPPSSWKPEYKVNEELRFTSQLQYIHKLQNRWGPNVQQMECIKKHLASINVDCEQPPLIGGIEVDLPKLHQTIQVFGGAQNVGEKKTWIKVADAMKIPKMAQDRATKLYDIYCKYLLSYDTLCYEEKTKLEQQVRNERQKRLKSQNQLDDSVVKGRSTSLGDFTRVARNTVSMWFKEDPTVELVECEYWKLLQDGQSHVVVQCGHVDTRSQGSAFPVRRDSPCARHGWNFNVLTQNPGSVLKSMGPVTGVTTPTLHIGMLFTTSCWSTDLHRLPYIQYLHTGADTVWYSIPKSEDRKFKRALSTIVPELVNDETTWLPEDTVMVSPDSLSQKGVSLGRCHQSQGQFMVVFSHCHTATLSCGFSISESVHFAYADWIKDGMGGAKQLNEMAEPELFSMEVFLCNLVKETTNNETLPIALQQLKLIIDEESVKADQLMKEGLKLGKQMCVNKDLPSTTVSGVKRRSLDSFSKEESVCEVCKKICFLFMVLSETEGCLCLDHAVSHKQRKKNLKGYHLLYRYSQEELTLMLSEAEGRLAGRDTTPEKTKSAPRRRSSNLRSISQTTSQSTSQS